MFWEGKVYLRMVAFHVTKLKLFLHQLSEIVQHNFFNLTKLTEKPSGDSLQIHVGKYKYFNRIKANLLDIIPVITVQYS